MTFGKIGRPIFLAGMMGSGKSTVGREISRRRAATFVDLDRRIEHLFGVSIASLFAAGEAGFRQCERDALCSLLAEPGFGQRPVVVALGGGTLVDPRNLGAVRAAGTTVYLAAAPETLAVRLSAAECAGRPLLEDLVPGEVERHLAELLAVRRASYDACELTVDADAGIDTVVERLLARLEALHKDG